MLEYVFLWPWLYKCTADLLRSAHISMTSLLPISQWASWVTCSFSGVFSQTKSLALQVMPFPRDKHRALLSKKKNGGTKGQSEQMGAFDIQQSGFIQSFEYFVTAYPSWGHGLKRGCVL